MSTRREVLEAVRDDEQKDVRLAGTDGHQFIRLQRGHEKLSAPGRGSELTGQWRGTRVMTPSGQTPAERIRRTCTPWMPSYEEKTARLPPTDATYELHRGDPCVRRGFFDARAAEYL